MARASCSRLVAVVVPILGDADRTGVPIGGFGGCEAWWQGIGRQQEGRDPEPSAGVIDSQPIKADAVVGSDSRGFDGSKLINGRKRHVVVDTLGLLLAVTVTAAEVGDRAAGQILLAQVAAAQRPLARIWAVGGFTGSLVEYGLTALALVLATVKRSDDMRGFVVLPKRRIVERERSPQVRNDNSR
ncbi:transposase [Streptomyces sp. NPDC058157]|uniref:transposase n=1 Tax=Streptomyces sp. NPDC058157 TaxID=3346360 RepID=UPI0036EB9C74